MGAARRLGFTGAVIALGVALAMAALTTTSSTLVHANSSPDLEVGTPSVDNASPYTGASVTLTATVTNAGDGQSAGTTLRYYSSTDATITTSDSEVGTDAVDALAASGTSEQSIDLTTPSTAGTYYFGACVDSVSGESDTSDNCSAALEVTVKARPDLSMGPQVSLSVGSPSPGESFTLRMWLSNHDPGQSEATTLRYYRSTDTTITPSEDTEVSTLRVPALRPTSYGPVLASITRAAPSTVGTYYYYGCVDSVAGESDTTNNCSGYATLAVGNTPATGAPTISGTAQVGQTLTSDTSEIGDDDGLDNVSYSYQWLADDTDIDQATSSTYEVQSGDNGKVIMVRTTFIDDAGYAESLTSAGTSAVVTGGL